jgi:hypothetical protein
MFEEGIMAKLKVLNSICRENHAYLIHGSRLPTSNLKHAPPVNKLEALSLERFTELVTSLSSTTVSLVSYHLYKLFSATEKGFRFNFHKITTKH